MQSRWESVDQAVINLALLAACGGNKTAHETVGSFRIIVRVYLS